MKCMLSELGRHYTRTAANDRLPSRVAAELTFAPVLSDQAIYAMQGIATWMEGQAKAMAVYDTPFWRDAGFSGDASGRFGPMIEVHDASPSEGSPYALFGFIGIPPEGRRDEQVLRQHLQAQLVRLFGPQAAEPAQLPSTLFALSLKTQCILQEGDGQK